VSYLLIYGRAGEPENYPSTPCFAWVLLTNHAHFLLRTGNEDKRLIISADSVSWKSAASLKALYQRKPFGRRRSRKVELP
jgi:hypothetical protein